MALVAAARKLTMDRGLHAVVDGSVAVLMIVPTAEIIRAAVAIRAAMPARVVHKEKLRPAYAAAAPIQCLRATQHPLAVLHAAARTRAVDGGLHAVVARGVAVLVIGVSDGIIRAAMAIRAVLPARVVRGAARVVVAEVSVAHAA